MTVPPWNPDGTALEVLPTAMAAQKHGGSLRIGNPGPRKSRQSWLAWRRQAVANQALTETARRLRVAPEAIPFEHLLKAARIDETDLRPTAMQHQAQQVNVQVIIGGGPAPA